MGNEKNLVEARKIYAETKRAVKQISNAYQIFQIESEGRYNMAAPRER